MNTLRPVRLKKNWRGQMPGHVFRDLPAGAAQTLVERGFAEYADESVRDAPVNRMMTARPMKKSRPSAA